MGNAIGKWIPPLLIVAAIVASMVLQPALPPTVVIDFDRLLPLVSEPSTETAPRWVVLYAMPALAVGLWALFRLFPTAAGQRLGRKMFRDAPGDVTSPEQFARFGRTYETIVLGVITLVLGFHVGALAAAVGAYEAAARMIPVLFGAALVVMGNVFPRLKPNWVAGIRTKHTLADADLWRKTHRRFGAAFVVAGLVTIATGLIAPGFGLIVGIAGTLVACIVSFVASRPNGLAAAAAIALMCAPRIL
jgi:uncharacterized membrane protein